jgi:hypothetical protein
MFNVQPLWTINTSKCGLGDKAMLVTPKTPCEPDSGSLGFFDVHQGQEQSILKIAKTHGAGRGE